MFNSLFLDVLNDHAPMKQVKIKSRPNPFITPEIRQLMTTRDNWQKRAIKTKDRLHWNTYRFFCQEVKRKIRFAEMEHVPTELENSNGNVNSVWKVLNRCLPRKDQPLSTTEDQANKFNKFYTSVSLSVAARAKTVAEEHNFYTFNQESNCCPINDRMSSAHYLNFNQLPKKKLGR